MNWTIRPVRAGDYDQWLPLWQGYQAFYKINLGEAVTASNWARMLNAREPVEGLVAERDGLLGGLAHFLFHRSTWSVADRCYLNDLFVAPDLRRQGIAEALIREVHSRAKAGGCAQVYWLTHETNADGRRLYDRIAKHAGLLQYAMAPF
jgi:GNAT superfamily N-acetyltransferase